VNGKAADVIPSKRGVSDRRADRFEPERELAGAGLSAPVQPILRIAAAVRVSFRSPRR
jgi:hypothetical protein